MTEHVVQFFQAEAELFRAVLDYLGDGMREGAQAVVIATAGHWHAIAREARLPERASSDDTVLFFDAGETLRKLMVDGRPDPERFDAVVGGLLRSVAGGGRPVRAYGEMVALLWEEGNVMAAIDLEKLWSELGRQLGFSLFCAYPGAASASPGHADARRQIQQLHTGVIASSRRFSTTRSFPNEAAAPSAARHYITDELRERGWDEGSIDAAAVAVTELASNAIKHARSSFHVSLWAGARGLRLEVRDADPTIPGPMIPDPVRTDPMSEGGRGLCLVDGVAQRWGVDRHGTGKVVWVELDH